METTATFFVSDRSTVVVILGVFALLILGPLTGIPAWVIANSDLNDLRSGYIHPSRLSSIRSARTLAIVGTFLSPIWLFVEAVVAFVILAMLFTAGGAVVSIM
jgi:hypothetical protein